MGEVFRVYGLPFIFSKKRPSDALMLYIGNSYENIQYRFALKRDASDNPIIELCLKIGDLQGERARFCIERLQEQSDALFAEIRRGAEYFDSEERSYKSHDAYYWGFAFPLERVHVQRLCNIMKALITHTLPLLVMKLAIRIDFISLHEPMPCLKLFLTMSDVFNHSMDIGEYSDKLQFFLVSITKKNLMFPLELINIRRTGSGAEAVLSTAELFTQHYLADSYYLKCKGRFGGLIHTEVQNTPEVFLFGNNTPYAIALKENASFNTSIEIISRPVSASVWIKNSAEGALFVDGDISVCGKEVRVNEVFFCVMIFWNGKGELYHLTIAP